MADAPYDPLAMDPDYAKQLLALHAGSIPTLRFDELVGLIGVRRFHGDGATTIRALAGIRGVGSAAFVVNALVIATVPVDGGHHLVDASPGRWWRRWRRRSPGGWCRGRNVARPVRSWPNRPSTGRVTDLRGADQAASSSGIGHLRQEQDLVDAATVHVDDLEDPVAEERGAVRPRSGCGSAPTASGRRRCDSPRARDRAGRRAASSSSIASSPSRSA